MKTYCACFMLLFCAASALAQPWQWELYTGNFYHPSGFPDPWDFSKACVGDFDGDGRDDYWSGSFFAIKDMDRFHWTRVDMPQYPQGHGEIAINLDGDAADELLQFSGTSDSAHVWKLIPEDPWSWRQRDDLLFGLSFPPGTFKALVGDYDGDGLLNTVCWTNRMNDDTIRLYTRQQNGTWQPGTIFYPGLDPVVSIINILDGDFDQDGDLDFGIITEPPADPITFCGYYYKNTGSGIADPYWLPIFFNAVGDLDGDGDWDALGCDYHRAGYFLGHTMSDSAFFHVAQSTYIGQSTPRIFGSLRVNGESVVTGIYNGTEQVLPGSYLYSFRAESRSPIGWVGSPCGLYSYFSFHCIMVSLADLDGDGLRDALVAVQPNSNVIEWRLYRNVGNDSTDGFSLINALPSTVPIQRVTAQIGDVTGDGRAELAVLAPVVGGSNQIRFYEMIGQIADTNFVLREDLSNGLPSALNFRMADLDNDGLSEALLYSGSSWDIYFFRGGHWDLYTNILPPLTASDISFADANDDGNLDIFTPTDVWLNLNPSSTDQQFIPHPSSLILSSYPNPFNATATIQFSLPREERIEMKVFNIQGRLVSTLVNNRFPAGAHSVSFDGSNLSSGIYLCRMQVGSETQTQKLMLLK